jgi:hypothetical protein
VAKENPDLPGSIICERCGHQLAEHFAANLTDGQFVGRYLTICPTAIFKHPGFDVYGAKL